MIFDDFDLEDSKHYKPWGLEDLRARLKDSDTLQQQVEHQSLGQSLAAASVAINQSIDLNQLEIHAAIVEALSECLSEEDAKFIEELAENMKHIIKFASQASTSEELITLAKKSNLLSHNFSRLKDLLKRIWEGELENYFGPMSRLGNLLAKIETTQDLGRRLSQSSANGLALAKNLPLKTEELDDYLQARDTCASIMEDFSKVRELEAFPSLIEGMFNKTATLADITPELFTWLFENNFASSIKVGL